VYKAGRYFSGHPFNENVWSQPFQEVDNEIQVLIKGKSDKISGVLGKFLFHGCPFYNLQLVEFEAGNG